MSSWWICVICLLLWNQIKENLWVSEHVTVSDLMPFPVTPTSLRPGLELFSSLLFETTPRCLCAGSVIRYYPLTHSLTLDSVPDAVHTEKWAATKISVQILEKCLLVIWCEASGWCGAAPQIKSPISQLYCVMRVFIVSYKLKPQRPLVWNTVQCWMFIAH